MLLRSHMTARLLCTLALASAFVGVLPVTAQELRETQMEPETLQLRIGDVLEILGAADAQQISISWVLTRDRTFVEAGRSATFQTRLTEPGEYLLEAAADFPLSGERYRKSITLLIEDRSPGDIPDTASIPFVRTSPEEENGTVALARNRDILLIEPSPTLTGPLLLDLDTNTDSNGDGDPSNDSDAEDTLFTQEKNRLFVWFVTPQAERAIRIVAPDAGSMLDLRILKTDQIAPNTQTPTPSSPSQPQPQPQTGEIMATVQGGGLVRFSFPLDARPQDVLYHWDFGDGTQSLLSSPTNQYTQNGDFTVSVEAHSLRDGRLLAQGQTLVTIADAGAVSSEATSAPSSAQTQPAEPEPSTDTGGAGGLLSTILWIIGIGGAAIAVGAVGTWIGFKILRRSGGLQQRIEDAEKKLMGQTPGSAIDVPPPPMELKRTDDTPAPEQEQPPAPDPEESPPPPPPQPQPTPPPQDFVDTTTAPPWLKQGLSIAPEQSTAAPAEPAPQPTVPEPTPEPPPVETPPWLTSTPAPAPTSTPPAPAEPSPAEPQSQPQQEPSDASVPPWLAAAQSTPAPELEPAPAPTELPTPTPPQPTPEPPPPEPPASPAPEPPAAIEPPPPPEPEPVTAPPVVAPPPEPEPAPIPQEPPPAPVPVPTPVDTQPNPPQPPEPALLPPTQETTANLPVATVQSQTPAQPSPPPQSDADERERERKRRKRQRYRENLKKRKEEEQRNGTPAPTSPPNPYPTPAPTAPSNPQPTPTPAPAPTPTPAPPQDSVQKAVADLPPEDPVAFMIRADAVEEPKAPDEPKKEA